MDAMHTSALNPALVGRLLLVEMLVCENRVKIRGKYLRHSLWHRYIRCACKIGHNHGKSHRSYNLSISIAKHDRKRDGVSRFEA